jgi:hypothetical protein
LVLKNLKLSEFRTALLEYVKRSFDKFFETGTEVKDNEEVMKQKHRLMCSKDQLINV